jgi:uncharacterized protein YjbI with pentapeptide repeats
VLADGRVSLYNVSATKEEYTMADQQQSDLLRKGVDAWNTWRTLHKEVKPNLRGAALSEANLNRANLSETDLSRADLYKVDLRGAALSEANLIGADLYKADLYKANLYSADLSGADLSGANLNRANLNRANLSFAHFSGADLSGADLSGATLIGADFSRADLSRTVLSKAIMLGTILGNVDLRTVKGLETIVHFGPSTIGMDTIMRSKGDIPDVFLRGAGLSDPFITYARSLAQNPIEYSTCFISFSSKDQEFAERLYSDLQQKGVRCWFAPEDMKTGDKIRHRIDESIRLYDKLLLVLSQHSIASTWVEHEVEMALAKEQKAKRTVLFPIRLDTAIIDMEQDGWPSEVRHTRHITDFSHWKQHDEYQMALARLLRDLQPDIPPMKVQ